MKAPFNFIVTPKGKKYDSFKDVNGVSFKKASSIEDAKDVSKEAIVVSLPHNYNGIIEVGDEVLIHHNIFRDYYDQTGKLRHSRAYIYENLYHAIEEEVFVVKKDGKWVANADFCFVEPIMEDNISLLDVGILPHTGTIYLSNTHKCKSPIGFTPESEYEVEIDGKVYYRMRDKDVCIYERFEA